jgi:hypothetical protein
VSGFWVQVFVEEGERMVNMLILLGIGHKGELLCVKEWQ